MKRLKAIFFFVVLLAIGIFVTVSGAREFKNSKRIIAEGKTVVGDVTDYDEHRRRRGRRSYYLTVEFETHQQQVVTSERKVSRGVYQQAVQTRSIPVHYLPSDPKICDFGEKAQTRFGTLVWGVLALIGSGVLGAGLFQSDDNSGAAVADAGSTPPAQTDGGPNAGETADASSSDAFEDAA